MRYPWLDVPVLTPTFLFALVAFAFSFIVHYAVGGGLLLALENGRALRSDDVKYRAYLKKYAKFFVEFTTVFGVVLGAGTWFAAGVTAPFATESFIRIFIFALAIELLLVFQALVSAFAFYYCWDKLTPRASRVLGWLYALTAWFALSLASALSSFTLNAEGIVGDWESTDELWRALLNVQFPAQLIARTGVAILIGAFFFLIHASYVEKDFNLRERVAKRMRVPSFVGAFLLVAGLVGAIRVLTETSRLTLERSVSSCAYATLFVACLLAILILVVVGLCRRPREINAGQSLALVLLGFATLGSVEGEISTIRRPYAVDRVVYRNQLTRAEVAQARQTGILYLGTWTTYALDALQEEYPDLAISAQKYLGVESIHLEPPVISVPEEGSEEDEGESGEPIEEDDPTSLDSESVGKSESNVWFALTAAQRLTAPQPQSNFAPVATNSGALDSSTPVLSQGPPLQNPNVSGGRQNSLSTSGNQLPAPRGTDGASSIVGQPETQIEVPVFNPAGTTSQAADGVGVVNVDVPAAPVPNRPAQPSARRPVRPVSQSQTPLQSVETSESDTVASPSPSPTPIEIEVTPASELASGDVDDALEEEQTRVLPETLDLEVNGPISRGNEDLLKVNRHDRRELGRMVFVRNCNSCHAEKLGLSAVAPRVGGRSVAELRDFVTRLNYVRFDMPPWAGTEVEAELLAEYLDSIAPKVPDSAFMKDKPKKEKAPPKSEENESEEEGDAVSEGVDAVDVPVSENGANDLIGL